ncbi:hypothetical protein SKAU_G00129830 [Synaphobranchus kaupii]|uniref:CARD domain-containing protein n=1 Tax=Synaphobranchus kaupii TaxID=118154 RepID=A0A9Q1FR61_SYNKA|nr:hypothetical protein SKAU_G00129830 [Synaphobranchus kaupii]
MERDTQSSFILDSNRRIAWQEDCYVDLQSDTCSSHTKMKTEGIWIQKYRKQLVQSVTGPFLESIVGHMRKQDHLSLDETLAIQAMVHLPEKVLAVIDTLATKGPQASESLQAFIEKTNTQFYQLITLQDQIMQKHTEALQTRYGGLVSTTPSLDSFANLLLVEGLSDLQQKEHDALQIEATKGMGRHHARQLALDKLLQPLTRVSIPPRILLTVGVSGIGKSTLVRHFVQLWSKGEICQDVSFIFPFAFWELNAFEKLSAERLVKQVYPHNGSQDVLPRTWTELYSYFFKMIVEGDLKEPLKIEQAYGSSRKMIGSLGRLAFYGLIKRKYNFHEQDMKANGIDLPSLQSSLSSYILVKEESAASTVYHFIHLSIQEFLAATYYYTASKRAIFDLFTESGMSWPKIGFQNHFKNALQRSQQSEDGQLDMFVRFLSGLLSPLVVRPLSGLLPLARDEHSGFRVPAASFMQGVLNSGCTVSLRAVNMVHCLQELQHTELTRTLEEGLHNNNLAGKLTPINCSVLAYLLQVSEECAEETNLSNCLNYGIVKSLLPQLLYCTNIRLENNNFKDDVMELLGSLLSAKDCHLQKISLAENAISNKGAKAISRSLMVNRSLTSLDFRSNNIGPKGAKALADALKRNQVLVSLSLQNNFIEEEGAKSIAEVLVSNRKLVTLNLQKNSISTEGAQRIAEALKKNQALRELILSSNQLGDKGVAVLAQALTVNHSLVSLHLQSNSISNKGVSVLTKALRLNRGLMHLNLRENSIGVEGAKDIAKALRENNTLRHLDLTANLLHDEGAKAIAGAVKVNQALTSLHLQWNFIKSNAAKALGHALLSNTTLQQLDLQENTIGDEGMIALAEALRRNTALTTLFLQGVSVGQSGAIALAEALTFNQTLHTLDLRGNSIGMEGAKAMSNALKTNRSLRVLNLQENSLGMDGAIFIATALTGNHNLTYINLQGNRIGESGAKVISDAIKTNSPNCVVKI